MCRITFQRVSPGSIFAQPIEVESNETTSNDRKRPLEDAGDDEDNTSGELRSGKWTNEEEVYADALIAKFENGTLSDCPEGKTLRAYLSKKLNCIPMRVSKKYGGKCIGKHIFSQGSMVDGAEDIERMGQLATACWDSINARLNNRKRKTRRRKGSVSGGSSGADESKDGSAHTDIEDLPLDDLLFEGFFYDTSNDDSSFLGDTNNVFDWSELSDDCLLLL